MGLLLHLNFSGLKDLPLKPSYPRVYPFTQMVNRVLINEIDPFMCDLRCETVADIVKLPANNHSFGDMVEAYATELKKLDEPIYLMYSGGIDSSSALIGFLRTWSAEELKRVHILASHHSAQEFPELWNTIVDTFKGRIHPSFEHVERYCEKGYVVTGEHGDQIFGSDVITKVVGFFGNEGIHKPWQETMPTVYGKIFELPPEEINEFIGRYERTLSACPFPIKSSFDWVWWFNFTNKWQHVKYRFLAHKSWRDPIKNFGKIRHFYDTPDWQRWSLDNHDKKIGVIYQSYKLAAKEYIVRSTGFSEYLQKPKVGSLFQLWCNTAFYEAIDTDFNYLNRMEAKEYIR